MAPVTIIIDGYLQNIDTADYQHSKLLAWMAISTDGYRHGGLSSWMAIGMAPVTISIDDHLQNIDTADYQHGGLSAWILLYIVIFLQDTSTDGYLHGSCNC